MSSKSLPSQRDQDALEREDFGPVVLVAAQGSFVKGGSQGIARESHLLALHWSFESENIDLEARDLTLWQGKVDVNCPLAMAERASTLLKGAQTRFLDEEGHSLVAHQSEAILKSFLHRYSDVAA